jgi:hypothetical protein
VSKRRKSLSHLGTDTTQAEGGLNGPPATGNPIHPVGHDFIYFCVLVVFSHSSRYYPRGSTFGMTAMTNLDKKERERRILDSVYGSRRIFEIKDNEQPDFLLKRLPSEEPFGVEVTEFFYSDSKARLDRISGYVGELLDGKDFRHRIDRKELTVGKGQILSKQKEIVVSGVPMIIQSVPSLSSCSAMVAEIIRVKGEKLVDAFEKLRHINLIIYDCTNLLCKCEPGDFYGVYCTDVLIKALFCSRFREVYFVVKLLVGEVFIPLKMVVTLAKLFFFYAVSQSQDFPKREDSISDVMTSFASYLASIANRGVLIHKNSTRTEIIYGDTGFSLTADFHPQLCQYFDAPPETEATVVHHLPVVSDQTVAKLMQDCEQANRFSTGIAFHTKSGLIPDS